MKKRLCVILSSALVLTCGAAAILLGARDSKFLKQANADVYTLTMSSAENQLDLTASHCNVKTESGYDIGFDYDYYEVSENHLVKLCQSGYLANSDPIHVMNSIKVNYTGEGALNIQYGFALPSDIGEQRCLKLDDHSLAANTLYEFNNEYPAYFQITVDGNDPVIIDSIEIKYSCKGTDSRSMSGLYEVSYSNEDFAVSNPGYFRYWNSRADWGGPQVDMGVTYANWDNSYAFVGYSVGGGGTQHASYGLQIFYKNPALTTGERYEMSFTAVAHTAKTVSLNGQTIAIPTTSQEMSVIYTEDANQASFRLVASVANGDDNYFQFQNISWAVVLAAPTSVALSNANVLTFTAAAHATTYRAQIVDSNMDPVGDSFVVESGDDITSNIPSGLSSGIYYVLVRSEAAGYKTSDWSANTASFVVGTVDPIPDAAVATAIAHATSNPAETDVISNAGSFYYWNDQGWCGSSVVVNSATHQHRVATIDYSVTNGACDFGIQLFFKNPLAETGKKYRLSLTVNSQIALTMKLNDVGESATAVPADTDTQMVLEYTEASSAASLKLIVPVTNGNNNTLVVSNITWTEVPAE